MVEVDIWHWKLKFECEDWIGGFQFIIQYNDWVGTLKSEFKNGVVVWRWSLKLKFEVWSLNFEVGV